MKIIASWAFASAAVVAILVAGCTTEVTDGSEGGVSTGAAGTSAAGAAGAGGDMSTTDGGGTGGSSSDTDSGSTAVTGPCADCAHAKCAAEATACEADKTGCGAEIGKFYTCISASGADETACSLSLVEQSNNTDAGGDLANDIASCMVGAMGCLETCQGGAGDAGTHE